LVAFGLNTAMWHRELIRARFDEVSWNQLRPHVSKPGAREQSPTPALVDIPRKEREPRHDEAG
jgi:hypothetical protein